MFDERLKKLRDERGLTQKQVAEILGMNPRTYSSYENNEREPNSEILILIADVFNVSIDYLLGYNSKAAQAKSNFSLTDTEKNLVLAYRAHPEMQAAVNKMLDITLDKGNVIADDITKELRQAMPSIKSNLQSR